MNKTVPAMSDRIVNLIDRYANGCKSASANVPISVYRMHFREFFDEARKILTNPAALAAQGQAPVAVKELEWSGHFGKSAIGELCYRILYNVNGSSWGYKEKGSGHYVERDVGFGQYVAGPFDTVEAAKAAAQSDYETRVRSALTAPAQPVGVPGGWRLVPEKPTMDMIKNAAGDHEGQSWLPASLWASMLHAVPQPPAEGGWMPMDSAPKDGTLVLVYVPDFKRVTEAWYCAETGLWPRDEAYTDEGEPCNVGLPSRWMPLPPAPANGGKGQPVSVSVERWGLLFDGAEGWDMYKTDDGEYVKFSDYEALLFSKIALRGSGNV